MDLPCAGLLHSTTVTADGMQTAERVGLEMNRARHSPENGEGEWIAWRTLQAIKTTAQVARRAGNATFDASSCTMRLGVGGILG